MISEEIIRKGKDVSYFHDWFSFQSHPSAAHSAMLRTQESSHLMIPSLSHGRIFIHNLLPAGAVLIVVVNDPTRLQMGVDRDSSHIFEPALLQVFADPI